MVQLSWSEKDSGKQTRTATINRIVRMVCKRIDAYYTGVMQPSYEEVAIEDDLGNRRHDDHDQ
jgi:hypothetical protein